MRKCQIIFELIGFLGRNEHVLKMLTGKDRTQECKCFSIIWLVDLTPDQIIPLNNKCFLWVWDQNPSYQNTACLKCLLASKQAPGATISQPQMFTQVSHRLTHENSYLQPGSEMSNAIKCMWPISSIGMLPLHNLNFTRVYNGTFLHFELNYFTGVWID